MIEEIEIKQIPVDQYSYIKGINLGLLMAREMIEDIEIKAKLKVAATEVLKSVK